MEDKESGYELERRFFGYHPVQFVDDVINIVSDYIGECTDTAEKELVKHAAPITTATPSKKRVKTASEESSSLHQGVEKLFNLYQAQLDKNFDKYELYLFQYIFPVPAEVASAVLPSASVKRPTMSEKEEAAMDEEILALRSKIRQSKALIGQLKEAKSSVESELSAFVDSRDHLQFNAAQSQIAGLIRSVAASSKTAETTCTEALQVLNLSNSVSSPVPLFTSDVTEEAALKAKAAQVYRTKQEFVSIRASIQAGNRHDLSLLRNALSVK